MSVKPATGTVPLDLPLTTPDGTPVLLGEVLRGDLPWSTWSRTSVACRARSG